MLTTLLVVALLIAVAILAVRRFLDAPDHRRYDAPDHTLIVKPGEISPQHRDVVAKLRSFHESAPPARDVAAARRQMEELFGREVEAKITPVDVDGIPGEWVRAEGARSDRRLLYLHGGAIRVGSPRSHRGITDGISRRTGASVLAIDYRMQPEHHLSACHEDSRTAYRWMLQHGPDGDSEPAAVFVAGDSAGGNLTLALIAWARDRGWRTPDAAVALAPLTDTTLSSPSWRRNLATDPFLGAAGFATLLKVPRALLLPLAAVMSRVRPNDPRFSPLLGDLAGLPPTLIQASEQEMLFDDARRYANKASEAGSPVTFQVWPTLVHVFQGFAPDLPEANDALDRIAAFIHGQIPASAGVAESAG